MIFAKFRSGFGCESGVFISQICQNQKAGLILESKK